MGLPSPPPPPLLRSSLVPARQHRRYHPLQRLDHLTGAVRSSAASGACTTTRLAMPHPRLPLPLVELVHLTGGPGAWHDAGRSAAAQQRKVVVFEPSQVRKCQAIPRADPCWFAEDIARAARSPETRADFLRTSQLTSRFWGARRGSLPELRTSPRPQAAQAHGLRALVRPDPSRSPRDAARAARSPETRALIFCVPVS